MKKLSIVVPIYNVEKYVGKCLQSACEEQDLPLASYEVIAVNDGSPDNSRQIAAEMAEKYENIVVVDRPNGGLSAARNTGIEHARGEYVMFLDSDDYLQKNSLGPMLKLLEEHRPDALVYRYSSFLEEDPDRRIESWTFTGEHHLFSGHEFLTRPELCQAPAWLYVYRRTLIEDHSLRFLEGALHEDVEFTPRAVCSAEKVVYWDSEVYRYLRRSGSIMINPALLTRRIESLGKVVLSLKNFADHHAMPPATKAALGMRVFGNVTELIRLCVLQGDRESLKRQVGLLKQNRLFPFPFSKWHIGFRASFASRLRQLRSRLRIGKVYLFGK